MSKIRSVLEDYQDSNRFIGKRGLMKLYNDATEAIAELEELELFKSEHLRLEAELNAILHPNGDGPTAPSFCDLVAYVRADIAKLRRTCTWDFKRDLAKTDCGLRLTRGMDTVNPNYCHICGGRVVRR